MRSKKDVAYEYLRRSIITCEIVPGSILDENEVAQNLHISRTPVREAVNKLAEEGLLEIVPRKGIIVSQMTVKDIYDLLDARLTVEPSILQRAVPALDKGSLMQLRSVIESYAQSNAELKHSKTLQTNKFREALLQSLRAQGIELDSAIDSDYSFHMFFAYKTGNSFLMGIEHKLMVQNERTRYILSTVRNERSQEVHTEHLAIVQALLDEDIDRALDAVQTHLNNAFIGFEQLHM